MQSINVKTKQSYNHFLSEKLAYAINKNKEIDEGNHYYNSAQLKKLFLKHRTKKIQASSLSNTKYIKEQK